MPAAQGVRESPRAHFVPHPCLRLRRDVMIANRPTAGSLARLCP